MRKVILITGISSGFGKETAALLAKKGHVVYGTVRKSAETDPLIKVLQMDLMNPDSITNAVRKVIQDEGRIDVLINNAGMHSGGPIETLSLEYVKMQMDTNFMGLVHLTREVLPVMRKQGGGTIINFGSIGGLMGLPFQGFYSASKFAVEGFSEALRMEVKQFNINVVVINPGDFHTNNSINRREFIVESADDPYKTQFDKTLSITENDEANGWDPEILAKKMVKIVDSKKPKQRYIIAAMEQKLAVILKRILPGKLFSKILERHYGIK
ncbi:MAG TPA: SDR family oxidoreductase [Draconibacterium sp.]|nr:SDR family oxidoreductase [Draconibacterium sp.]